MRFTHLAIVAVLASACQATDLTLPPAPTKPQPGTIYGTIVYAVPGKSTPVPAAGASITILGAMLSTTAGANGDFLLSGVTQSTGQMLVQYDSTMKGMADHQLLIDLASINAGVGRQIDLGQVLVVANASVNGKALLGDMANSPSGHGGTEVFVPAGPFTTYTNDDGSYALVNLPAGTISIQYFHAGYEPYELDGIVLQAGQDFEAATIDLAPVVAAPAPGTIAGKITFNPAPANPTATVVAAVPLMGSSVAGMVQQDGTFLIAMVPAGVYSVTVSLSGYSTISVPNVLVVSGGEEVLPGVVLNAGNGVVNCMSGQACTPTNVCNTGTIDCSTGNPVCKAGGNAPNGAVCATGEVCDDGMCVACLAAQSCMPANPCHVGETSCASGTSVCQDMLTEETNGTVCGTGEVCLAGACTSCPQGTACNPSDNACHLGSIDCSTGEPVCLDTQGSVQDGMGCGPNEVCSLGVCTMCEAGGSCTVPSDPCHTATYSCSTGQQECVASTQPAMDGNVCGMNEVCNGGVCTPCTAGGSCTPDNACHAGVYSCSTGTQLCVDSMMDIPDGMSCGSGEFCHSGSCGMCPQASTCIPMTNACHTGSIDCGTGLPLCTDTLGTLSDGHTCGMNQVCSGGSCVGCTAGGACNPPGFPCDIGQFECTTGQQICVDQQAFVPPGQSGSCNTNEVCGAGSSQGKCVACATGGSCVPSNVCDNGVLACGSGAPLCVDTLTAAPNGNACGLAGANEACQAGLCVPTGFQILSGGSQSVFTDQEASPVVIALAYTAATAPTAAQAGDPIVGAMVTVTPPAGGAALFSAQATSATTDSNGHAQFVPLLPRTAGTYNYSVSSPNQGSIAVPVTAANPPASTIFTMVNLDGTNQVSGVPGPGVLAHVETVRGIATAPDGTIYFADYGACAVRALAPSGQLTTVAGGGTCGATAGDSGAPAAATLNSIMGLAYDATNKFLYIADAPNNVIRKVDFGAGVISTFAGGGSAGSPLYGDGGAATSATLSSPQSISLGPDGTLYVADSGHSRIRRINPSTQQISAWITPSSTCPSSGVALYNVYSYYYAGAGERNGAVAWDASGNAYVSGQIWGPASGSGSSGCNNPTYGIVRVNSDGSYTHIAGYYQGTTSDGGPAVLAQLPDSPGVAFDSAGNLYATFPSGNVIKRIDAGTGTITTVAGTGTSGFSGEYVASTLGAVDFPWAIAFDSNQNLIFSDGSNASIRVVTAAASEAPIAATLAKSAGTSGDAQTVAVAQLAAQPLSVTLTDTAGALAGYQVIWTPVDPGGAVGSTLSTTNASGVATAQVRAGTSPGVYHFTASFSNLAGSPVGGSPQTFTLTATAETQGNLYTLVNLTHSQGNSIQAAPGPVALIGQPYDVTVAKDGTIYFTDYTYCLVRQLSPGGVLTTLAGTSCGYSGDNGPAASAQLYNPQCLALDESVSPSVLYVCDNSNHAIRAITLGMTPTIAAFAGPGNQPNPGYGDGDPVSQATFSSLDHLAIGPDGLMYVGDTSQERIRTIDIHSTSPTIQNWLSQYTFQQTSVTCPAVSTVFYSCGSNYGSGCSIAWDASGNPYVSGEFLDAQTNCNGANGIARINLKTGAATRVAGQVYNVSSTNKFGSDALNTSFDAPPYLAMDSSGNLFMSDFSLTSGYSNNNMIARMDPSNGELTVIAGTGTAGYLGDNVAGTTAELNAPQAIALDSAGNLIVMDRSNYSVRAIAGVTSAPAGGAVLSTVSGTPQTATIDFVAPVNFVAKLADGSGHPLVGYPVSWATVDDGSYLYPSSGITDSNGETSVLARAGPVTGKAYTFTVSFITPTGTVGTGSPQTFTLNTTAPTTGDIFTIENIQPATPVAPPGPATMASVGQTQAVTTGPDGTIYFSTYNPCQVWAISTGGYMTLVAGLGSCTSGGDNGPAISAYINNPNGLAVDPGNTTLYISDTGNNRIRAVNLTSLEITTFAGGGTTAGANDGDGGPALGAYINYPTWIGFGPAPDGTGGQYLYLSDTGDNRIRYIDSNAVIHPYISPSTVTYCNTAVPLMLWGCPKSGTDISCSMAWDGEGNAYVSAQIGGTEIDGTSGTCSLAYGIFRINAADGTNPTPDVLIAGESGGSITTNGIQATAATFNYPPSIVVDAAGDVYTLDYNSSLVRKISAATGQINTVVGTGTAGFSGDYGASTSAEISNPYAGVLVNGHLIFTDYTNKSVREVW